MGSDYDWLNDLPVAAGPPDLRMGTRALDMAGWLAPDALADEELALRAKLFVEHPDFVHVESGHDAAIDELGSLVEIHIGDRMRHDIDDPMERLALSVQEDVLLMHRSAVAQRWVLIGGTLLFPNQWTLQ